MPGPRSYGAGLDEFPRLHRRQRAQRHDHVGSTDNLSKRIWEHKAKVRPGFSKTYGCDQLVWFESFETRTGAFRRERQIKEWRRSWKLLLIEENNPTWRDLYDGLNGDPDPNGALYDLGPGIRRDERI